MAKKKTKRKSGPVKYHTGKFPPVQIDWSRLVPLIGPANAALARYDGLLSAIPNAAILLSGKIRLTDAEKAVWSV